MTPADRFLFFALGFVWFVFLAYAWRTTPPPQRVAALTDPVSWLFSLLAASLLFYACAAS